MPNANSDGTPSESVVNEAHVWYVVDTSGTGEHGRTWLAPTSNEEEMKDLLDAEGFNGYRLYYEGELDEAIQELQRGRPARLAT